MISAIILASGYANRMGQNKLLLPYKQKPIVEHVIDTVLNYKFHDIILVGKDYDVLNIGKRKNIKTITNNTAYKGQSEAIKLGISNISASDGYMFFTGDQPLLQQETLELLISKFIKNMNSIIVPVQNNNRGTPVIFPKRFKQSLLNLEGDIGGKTIINSNIDSVIFTNVTKEYCLFDIDTPEDYETLINIK